MVVLIEGIIILAVGYVCGRTDFFRKKFWEEKKPVTCPKCGEVFVPKEK